MSYEEIQSKIKKIEDKIEEIEKKEKKAQDEIDSIKESLKAENLDNKKREGLEAQVASLQARLASLDAQIAELRKSLAGYEQDLRELNKPIQTASGAVGDSFVSDLINKVNKRFSGMFEDIGEKKLLSIETMFFNALFQEPEMPVSETVKLVRFCQPDKTFEIPFGLHPIVSGLFVRQFYSILFDKLANTKTSLQVVTGNPGIGKTFFGFYILRKFIQQRRSVIYEPNQPGRIEVAKEYSIYQIVPNDADQGVSIKKYNRKMFFDNLENTNIENSNFIHIVDGHEPQRFGNVPIILITSNRRMNLEEFKKGSFDEWFMPLWSNEELLQYRDHFYPKLSKEVVNRLFDHWNGLIRYVISKPADYKAKELKNDVIIAKVDEFFDDAINKSNVTTLGEYLYGRDYLKNDVEISNKIILLNISTSTFEKEDVFMTYHARKQVIAQLDTKSQEELLNMIYTITSTKDLSNKISTKLDGLFEELAGEILAAGRTLCVRKMVDYGQEIPKMIKISFPKRTKETANYKSNAAQAKQGAEKANEKQTKGIVSTIQEYDEFTKILFRINHSFPTFDYVCYFNESISNDNTVEKGPCTFQMTVGNTHSNNVTWDSYNLFHSLYSSSNERKIKHFIVVPLPNFEKFTYKNDFQTSDKKLIEYLFENAPDKDKGNVSEDEKKRIANKVLSEKFKQCVDQYCLNIDYRIS